MRAVRRPATTSTDRTARAALHGDLHDDEVARRESALGQGRAIRLPLGGASTGDLHAAGSAVLEASHRRGLVRWEWGIAAGVAGGSRSPLRCIDPVARVRFIRRDGVERRRVVVDTNAAHPNGCARCDRGPCSTPARPPAASAGTEEGHDGQGIADALTCCSRLEAPGWRIHSRKFFGRADRRWGVLRTS